MPPIFHFLDDVHMHVHRHLILLMHTHMLADVESCQRSDTAMGTNRGPERPASQFAEDDYCFGSGPLWLRVERVHWANPVEYNGDTWYEVDGIEVSSTGCDVGRRRVLIRAHRLTRLPTNRRR